MSGVLSFFLAHQAVFSAFGIALLDLAFALNNSWQSNGVLHWIYMQLQALSGKPSPSEKSSDAQKPQ